MSSFVTPVPCGDLSPLPEVDHDLTFAQTLLELPSSASNGKAYISNEEVLTGASLPVLLQVRLRWGGHVARIEDIRMPKAVFLGEL